MGLLRESREEYCLPPALFNIYIEYMIRNVVVAGEQAISIRGTTFNGPGRRDEGVWQETKYEEN